MLFPRRPNLKTNDEGIFDLGAILTLAAGAIVAIITVIIVLNVLSTGTPQIASATNNITENVSTADWGDSTANAVAPSLGTIIAIGALFMVVVLAVGAFFVGRRGD